MATCPRRALNLDTLKGDTPLNDPRKVRLDRIQPRHTVHERRRPHKVRTLDQFQSRLFKLQSGRVKRASLVGNQHNPGQLVKLHQELEFIHHSLFFKMSLGVPGEARRTTGQRYPVIPGQLQPGLQKVVKVLTHAAVGAVNRRGVNAGPLVCNLAFVRDGPFLLSVSHAASIPAPRPFVTTGRFTLARRVLSFVQRRKPLKGA